MAERAHQKMGVLASLGLTALFAAGYSMLSQPSTQWLAYICAGLGVVTALKGLSALSDRLEDINKLLRRTRKRVKHGGAAQLMSAKDAAKAGLCGSEGAIIGTVGHRLLRDNASTHGLWIAPPGSGKTTRSLVPMAADCAASGAWDIVLVIDPKPETGPMLKPFCEKRGIPFYSINTSGRFDELMGPSAHFNQCDLIIQAAEQGRRSLLEDCYGLNVQLIRMDNKGEDKNIWWKRGGIKRVTVLQAYFALTNPARCNYPDILKVLGDPIVFEKMLDEIALREDLLDGDLARLAKSIIKLEATDLKNASTMVDEADGALQMFMPSGSIAPTCKDTSFDLAKPCMITLSTDAAMVDTQSQLVGLNLLALMRLASRQDRPMRMKVMYDEAAFCPVHNLNDLLVIARGLGVSFEVYLQTEADGQRVLGEAGYKALVGNCDRIAWFGLTDGEEDLSKRMGEVATLKESYREDGSSRLAVSYAHEKERLMSADEIRRLPSGYGIVRIRNHKFIVFRTLSYAEINRFKDEIRHSPWQSSKLKMPTRVWL